MCGNFVADTVPRTPVWPLLLGRAEYELRPEGHLIREDPLFVESGSEKYCTHASISLVRPNCVMDFVADIA